MAHCLPEWRESSIAAPSRRRRNGAKLGLDVLFVTLEERKKGCLPDACDGNRPC